MKPPPFAYAAPREVGEAFALLATHGGEARVMAGGQSLMPLLALRVVRPAVVVDIGRIAALEGWTEAGGTLRIGALVRQRALLHDAALAAAAPLLAQAARFIGHPATRSRGTIVGSLCHADPAAELPICAQILGAELTVGSARGERVVAAAALIDGALSTVLEDGELVTALRVPPPPPRTGYAFREIARRHGDFALVAVGCAVSLDARGQVIAGRIGLAGVAQTPRCFDLMDPGLGLAPAARLDDDGRAELARRVAGRLEPETDLHATAAYRTSIAAVLVEDTLRLAVRRAGGGG